MARQARVPDVTRRRLMGLAGLVGVSAVGTALAPDGIRIEREPSSSAQSTEHEGDHGSEVASAQTTASQNAEPTADEMDAMHEAGVKAFPAQTAGLGGQPLVFVQSEFYAMEGDGGVMVPDADSLFSMGTMTYVTFNGYANQYVEHPIKVHVGEPIRIFVVNCGPNIWSSFHVVGAIVDRVCLNANPKNEMVGMQGVSIGPGDGACVEFKLDEPGTYVAVNHSFGHAAHGAIALLQAE